VDADFDEAFGERPAQDSILQEARKEAGKDGDDLEAHAALDHKGAGVRAVEGFAF
jgi:hypothetical protein